MHAHVSGQNVGISVLCEVRPLILFRYVQWHTNMDVYMSTREGRIIAGMISLLTWTVLVQT